MSIIRVPMGAHGTLYFKKDDAPRKAVPTLPPIGGRSMEKKTWSRKKTFTVYLLSIPFVAALFVYYTMNKTETVGVVSLLAASIILFAEVEAYLRETLEARRRRRGE